MRRQIIAVALAGLLASPAVLHAAPPAGGYSAVLTTPAAAPRQEIVAGVLWKCAGDRCAAPAGGSRAVLVCQRVAKTFGPLARFTAPGGDLSSEDLSRCNAP